MNHKLAIGCSALMLAGCTSLDVTPYTPKIEADQTNAPVGVVYHLPRAVLDVTVMRTIVQCPTETEKLQVLVKPEVAVRFEADPDARYVLDYLQTSSIFKKTTVTVTVKDGILKGVDANIVDKTDEVAKSTVQGAINIAKMVAGVPSTPTSIAALSNAPSIARFTQDMKEKRLDPGMPYACNDATVASVRAAVVQKTKKRDATARLAAAVPGTLAAKAAEKDIADADKALAALIAKLSHATTVQVVPRRAGPVIQPTLLETLPITAVQGLADSAVKEAAMLKLDAPAEFIERFFVENKPRMGIKNKLTGLELAETFRVAMLVDVSSMPTGQINAQPTNRDLVYREPRVGQLVVCATTCWTTGYLLIPKPDRIGEATIKLPQAGVVATLPLRNGPFDENTLNVQFADDGGTTLVKYISESQAAKAAATFAALTGSVGSLTQVIRTAETERAKQDAAQNKAKLDELKSKKDLDDFVNLLR